MVRKNNKKILKNSNLNEIQKFEKKPLENKNEALNMNTIHSFNKITNAYSPISSIFNMGITGRLNDLDLKRLELYGESISLIMKLDGISFELGEVKKDRAMKVEEYEKLKKEFLLKEKINHISPKICKKAQQLLFEEKSEFIEKFKEGFIKDCVVLSIDIRRSTELMLKARSPELFSKFITELTYKLSENIKLNFGIFDKFTGDGILAFFPSFYSGQNAIKFALKSAIECHEIFLDHYNNSRNCFNVFIKDIGLGIGIDFGNVTLVNNGSELTVVGIPVVYACRFSGAKAGDTLLNIPAFEEISEKCKNLFSFSEVELEIKNEGKAIGYKILLNDGAFGELPDPIWE